MNNINEELDEYVSMFNNLCEQIGLELVKKIHNNPEISMYHNLVVSVMKVKKKELISTFLLHIYNNDKYRIPILNLDETIFLKGNLDDLTSNGENGVQIMILLRNSWGSLDSLSKEYFKESLKMLVEICDLYIEKQIELNKLKSKK